MYNYGLKNKGKILIKIYKNKFMNLTKLSQLKFANSQVILHLRTNMMH